MYCCHLISAAQRIHFVDVVDEVEPAHAESPGQDGAEPAELVTKKLLHQRARFAHENPNISRISIDHPESAAAAGVSRMIASAAS